MPQQELQRPVMDALGHVIGVEPGHAEPADRSAERRADAVDDQPGLELDRPGDGTPPCGRRHPGVTPEMRGGHDAVLRQIAELVDVGMLGEIARGCDDHAPDVAADPNSHHGPVRQLGDAQGDIDFFLDQIGVAVERTRLTDITGKARDRYR